MMAAAADPVADLAVTQFAQHEGQRLLGQRQRATRLRADRTDRRVGDQQVEHGAHRQRADQADRDIAVRILGLFSGGRDRVEADIGEEDRSRRAEHADAGQRSAPAIGQHRHEVRAIGRGQGDDDEGGQGDDLHDHQHRGELGALGGADHQQPGHEQRNQEGDQVERALRGRAIGHDHRVVGPGSQRVRKSPADAGQEAIGITGPTHGHGAGGDRVFEDQRPADHPGDDFAEHGIRVGVGGAGDRHHRGDLGVDQCGQRADGAGDDEAVHHARAGLFSGDGSQHEDTGADDGADTEHHQLEPAELPHQSLPFGRSKNLVQRFDSLEKHYLSPDAAMGAKAGEGCRALSCSAGNPAGEATGNISDTALCGKRRRPPTSTGPR